MKTRYLIGGAIALVFVVITALSLDNSKIEYTNLGYAQSSGKRSGQGAWVKDKGCTYNSAENTFTFVMRDDANTEVKSHS